MSTISISQTPALHISTNPLVVPTVITGAALTLHYIQSFDVILARKRLNVPTPATTGALGEFDRYFRSHANMSESLVSFIPSLFAFSLFVSEKWAGILGSTWVVGRIIYHLGYRSNSDGRRVGYMISSLAGNALLIGAFFVSGKRLLNRCT
eukprot:TRINITY_DN67_c0_g1_i1.p1 TRINITY_DN67_c0_g1~~TRINITY_DN67_c0_g1_i1.p1  ORF type:complete len:151 (-),score=42.65 TRINITY_DN67_c0_g1_i1:109-561(-)